MNKWLGVGATVLIALVAGGWQLSAEVSDTKRRVDSVERAQVSAEKRQSDERKELRESISETSQYVKSVDQNVQLILQKLSAMEAVQRADRRRDR